MKPQINELFGIAANHGDFGLPSAAAQRRAMLSAIAKNRVLTAARPRRRRRGEPLTVRQAAIELARVKRQLGL